jgi:drug/metabolite transporter (DMT)-like permease
MSNRFISWVIFIFLCLVWGSSFILMKISKQGFTATQIAALRIFSGSIVFIPFAFFHITKLPRKKIGIVALAGLFGNLIPSFMFTAAINGLDSSLVGILNSLTPICVVTLGIIFFRDKIQAQKILGVLIGFAGLCILTFTQHDVSLDNLGYAALIIIATFSYGVSINLIGHFLKGVNPLHITSVSLSLLTIPTFIVLWKSGFFTLDFSDTPVQNSLLATSLLGLVGTGISTVLFYILVQKAGGLFASLVTYGIPFVAILWGVLDGEPVTAIEIICLGIILVGVFLANKKT